MATFPAIVKLTSAADWPFAGTNQCHDDGETRYAPHLPLLTYDERMCAIIVPSTARTPQWVSGFRGDGEGEGTRFVLSTQYSVLRVQSPV